MSLPLGRTQQVSPKITALFKKLAREKSFTDEMITMLPSQGEHCPALCWAGLGNMGSQDMPAGTSSAHHCYHFVVWAGRRKCW